MAWSVAVSADVCQGYACCVMAVPTVFDLDDDTGQAVVLDSRPADALRAAVEGAARACPVHAIRIEDDDR